MVDELIYIENRWKVSNKVSRACPYPPDRVLTCFLRL